MHIPLATAIPAGVCVETAIAASGKTSRSADTTGVAAALSPAAPAGTQMCGRAPARSRPTIPNRSRHEPTGFRRMSSRHPSHTPSTGRGYLDDLCA